MMTLNQQEFMIVAALVGNATGTDDTVLDLWRRMVDAHSFWTGEELQYDADYLELTSRVTRAPNVDAKSTLI